MYMPSIKSANPVARAPLGEKYALILLDNIKSEGMIQYAYIVVIYDNETQQPVYFVSSEVNSSANTLGGGSHFLCAFDGSGHLNYGASDEWADAKKFFAKALELVEAHLEKKS